MPGLKDPRKEGRSATQSTWNAELDPKIRVPIANQIASMLRVTPLIDAGDERELSRVHEAAIKAHIMGYDVDSLKDVEPAWKENWAYEGGVATNLLKFLSQSIQAGTETKPRVKIASRGDGK